MKKQLEFMRKNHPKILRGDPPYLVVRFRPELGLTYDVPVERQLRSKKVTLWETLRKRHPGLKIQPHFQALPPERLRALIQRAAEADPDYQPGAFFSYFTIRHADPARLLKVAEALKDRQEVEYSYLYVPAPAPVVNAADDPRAVNQGYLDAAPGGIDARYAWGFAGGDGAGMRLVDVERGWTFNHEDLAAHGATLIHGSILDSDRNHGTSVLGEICAVDNTLGCVGITPNLASVSGASNSGSTHANAILAGIAVLHFGDVILLEAQNWVPEISMMLGPIELADDTYEAIRLATALGIVVVEAGGNGTNNGGTPPFALDAYVNAAGNAIFNPGGVGFRDSGAILVTAATSVSPHTRLAYAPHGQRIDNYAWGRDINTTDSDATGATTLYRTNFGGTSGASPIVTGAALAIQGMAQASLGFRFGPRQLRALLRDPAHGTPRAPAETTQIGVMPDLGEFIDHVLNVAPDVYLRDFVGDVGDPHTGAISASPDVIVRSTPVANPQLSFGEGSGTENSATLGSTVQGGVNNLVYVRVRNRGGANAANVQATVYWSPVASLVTPDLWTLVGQVTLPSVPNGNQLTVSNAINWPAAAVPGTGHYCFVALVGNPLDPAPLPADFLDWTNFNRFIRDNNNVTWRNFNVVPPSPSPDADPAGFVAMPFLLVGAPDRARPFDFVFAARLPKGARLQLELPESLYRLVHASLPKAERVPNSEVVRAWLNPFAGSKINGVTLPAKYRALCRLLVRLPKAAQEQAAYRIELRQFFRRQQVGGITWQVGGKEG